MSQESFHLANHLSFSSSNKCKIIDDYETFDQYDLETS